MDQAPDASDRIVDDRAMRRFEPAIPGNEPPVAHDSSNGSHIAPRHSEVPFERPSLSFDDQGAIMARGLPTLCSALVRGCTVSPSVKQPHSRSARVRFAAPFPGAGRVPNSPSGARLLVIGPRARQTAPFTKILDVKLKGLSR
jgi:hypothetical protein